MVPLGTHVASPDDIGTVDVRIVVNPVAVHVMMRTVAHDHEMLAGNLLQVGDYFGMTEIAAGPARFDRGVGGNCGDAEKNHSKANYWQAAGQSLSYWGSVPSPNIHVACALNDNEVHQAGGWCDIVREGPGFNQPANAKEEAGKQREAHAAVTQGEGQGQQGKRECRANIETPKLERFMRGAPDKTGEGTRFLKLRDFPSGVVI